MKNLGLSTFFFVLFTLLCALALWGVVVMPFSLSFPVGSYQLGVYENGLALHQDGNSYFYSFNPFNDYTLDQDGTRSALFQFEDLKNKKITSDYRKNHFLEIKDSILHYFHAYFPVITFKNGKEISFKLEKAGDHFQITKKLFLKGFLGAKTHGSALNYYGGDFVFDREGNLYTYQFPEDINQFISSYSMVLNLQLVTDRIRIPSDRVYILNPNTIGVIEIIAKVNQQIYINPTARLIELEEETEPRDSFYQYSMEFDVLPDVPAIQKKS